MCLAAGIWLEGVNFAIGSGAAAGRAAAKAIAAGDTSSGGLAGYRARLESSFVMQDHRRLRDAPHLVMGELSQRHLPEIACGVAEQMFTVTNPRPKPRLNKIVRQEVRRSGARFRDLARDGWRAMRTFG
jgi:electron transfer flavoprotein-quinone oxidoreductase